jgi:co-chaperonin GroES (HSP10)
MTRLLHVAGLAATLISPVPAVAQTQYTCGPGVVQAVHRVTETTIRDTTTTARDTAGLVVAIEQSGERRQRQIYSVAVQLGDRVYTSASGGDPNGTLDPLRLAAGDPIAICVNAVEMVLEAADATDYRAPVVNIRTSSALSELLR